MQSPPALASLTNIVTRPPRCPLPAPPRPSSVPVPVWWARRAASCAYREGGAPVHAVARLPEWASHRQAVHGEFGAGARPGVAAVSPPLPPTANGNRGDGAGRAQRAVRGGCSSCSDVRRTRPPARDARRAYRTAVTVWERRGGSGAAAGRAGEPLPGVGTGGKGCEPISTPGFGQFACHRRPSWLSVRAHGDRGWAAVPPPATIADHHLCLAAAAQWEGGGRGVHFPPVPQEQLRMPLLVVF